MPNTIRLFLTIAAAAFALASSAHGGVLLAGWEHSKAATAEGVIAAVLALGLIASWISPARVRGFALAVMSFALLGTLVGAFTIAVGIGSRTAADIAFHALLLVGLAAGLFATWRTRSQAAERIKHSSVEGRRT